MCSVGDDFENEGEKHMPAIEKIKLTDTKCNKCREEIPILLLRHKDAYCKNCFLTGANHKFKALLGKSKLIRPNDRVLISYEVGHPSTALLHMLRNGLDLNTQKKLRFEPVFIFIEDVLDQYHLTVNERNEMVNKIIKEASSFKFQLNLVSFADTIVNHDVIITQNNLTLSESDIDKVNSIIVKGTNKTNRKEILNIMRRNTLLSIARKLNCRFIFTPELSVDIASNLLTNISLGRGSQVPVDTGFCDDRDEGIKILRPLRTFDMKEIALYNVLHGLEPVSIRQPEVNQYSSIQALMKQFINDLQENYPATVATVVRTGDKLALDQSKIAGKCKLCQGILITKTEELNSEESTNFSKLVSNELPDHSIFGQERYTKTRDKFDSCAQMPKGYCFSCSKISEYLLGDV